MCSKPSESVKLIIDNENYYAVKFKFIMTILLHTKHLSFKNPNAVIYNLIFAPNVAESLIDHICISKSKMFIASFLV